MSTVRSSSLEAATVAPAGNVQPDGTAFHVLAALSFSHLLNDTIQSLIPAIYPVLKERFALSFTQIGLITLALQLTASLLQPLVGLYTDRRPTPFSLALGMGFTLAGLLLLSVADTSALLLAAAGSSASGRRCSTRSRRGWRGWRPAGGTGWPSRCSRSAATSARRSARCWPRSSSCRGASAASRGARARASPAWLSCSRVGRWYRRARQPSARGGEAGPVAARPRVAAARGVRGRHPGGADLLEVLLPGEPDQLLHALPDRQVRGLGAERRSCDLFVFLGGGGRRHVPRRADRRPHRAQGGHLGVDPRRAAVHACAAAREPVLDRRADGPRSA